MSFAVQNTLIEASLEASLTLIQEVVPEIASITINGTAGEIDALTVGNTTTLSLSNPVTSLNIQTLTIPTGGSLTFKGGIQAPVVNYVLTALDTNGTVGWAPGGGTAGSTFTNITVSNLAAMNLANFQYNTTNILQNQVLATDNTANKNVISIPYTATGTVNNSLVLRDGSGNFTANTITLHGIPINNVVITNGSNQLSGINYTSANTATSIVERDGTGSFAAGTVTTTGFVLTTGATNGYILTSNAGGTASWTAPTVGVSSITGTANQITASAATGAVTLSLPTTVNLTNVNVSGLTASQAVVTDTNKNLISLPYTSTNTASSLVERDGTGSFAAGTATLTGLALTTGATNGYILTSNAGGTASWQAPSASGVTTITGTANQITASASTGAVTLSLPSTVNLTNVNVSGLTASQAVVTDGSKNLVSLPYASANTASSLVERDGSGNFSAGTISMTGANVSGLNASQAVVTDGAKNLSSLTYTSSNIISTLVSRDGNGVSNFTNYGGSVITMGAGYGQSSLHLWSLINGPYFYRTFIFSGSWTTAIPLQLPDATTLPLGFTLEIQNAQGSGRPLTVLDIAGAFFTQLQDATYNYVTVFNTVSYRGWQVNSLVPTYVGENSANIAYTTISANGVITNQVTASNNSNFNGGITVNNAIGNFTDGLTVSGTNATTLSSSSVKINPNNAGSTVGYVLSATDTSGTVAWTPATGGGGVASITGTANQITASSSTGAVTLSLPSTVNLTNVNVSGLTASQAVVTDGSKNLVSLGYTNANTASTLVERDGSGNFSAGTISMTGANISGLTASQAVVTDGSKNLTSLSYSNASTASTLVQRDANKNISTNNFIAGCKLRNYSSTTTDNILAGDAYNSLITIIGGAFTVGLYLPDATTVPVGQQYALYFYTGSANTVLNLYASGGTTILNAIYAGNACVVTSSYNVTASGSWVVQDLLPDFITTNNNSISLPITSPNQAVVTDNNNYMKSITYTALNSPSSIVSRDVSGNMAAGQGTFTNLVTSSATPGQGINIASLTASQAVVSDAFKNLVSLAYTPNNTVSTIVSRDSNGSFSGYIGTFTSLATTGTTAGQSVNIASLTAGQAVVSDGGKNLVSLAYTPNNTVSTIVSRDAAGNLAASQGTFTNLVITNTTAPSGINIASLTAGQAVVSDTFKNLVSLAYTPNNTVSTIVSRDSSGNSAFNAITVGGASGNNITYNNYPIQDPNTATAGQILSVKTSPSNQLAWTNLSTNGTFTPYLNIGGGTTGVTYSTQIGNYTVTGNTCTISINIALSLVGSLTGNLTITGLPFPSRSAVPYQVLSIAKQNIFFVNGFLSAVITTAGSTTISLNNEGNGGSIPLQQTNIQNSTQIYITGTYLI